MSECSHFWRAVDSHSSQCAKCGEMIYRECQERKCVENRQRIKELEAAIRDVIHYAKPRYVSTREKAVREGAILSGALKHYEIMPHIIHQAQAALEGSDE